MCLHTYMEYISTYLLNIQMLNMKLIKLQIKSCDFYLAHEIKREAG